MPTVVLNLDKMGGMIFWRLIIVSRQKDCKFNYMLILCLGSFLSIALHILTVYIFTCNYGACFKNGCLFSPSELTREVNCHFLANELGYLTFFSFLELENYFLSQTTINQFLV